MSLAARGIPMSEIDDVAQETALRALESGVHFEDAEHLRRWCFVVARRLIVDAHRRSRRAAPLEEAAAAVCADAARSLEQVEDRDVLRRVAETIPLMRPADQSALRRDLLLEQPMTAAERNRANVARHRARGRLRRLVGPFAAITGACSGTLRRPGSGVAAVALPALVALSISAADGFASDVPELSTPHVTFAQPRVEQPLRLSPDPDGAASSAASSARPPRAPAAESAPAGAASADARELAFGVTAPAQTHVGVRRSVARPHDSLLCLEGDLINVCLDPSRVEPPAAAPSTAVLEVHEISR